MALETLKDVSEIGGFELVRLPRRMSESEFDEATNGKFVFVCDEANVLTLQFQNGPVKENGVNGCQVDTLIETAKIMIEGLNKKFPCPENSVAIAKLDEALRALDKRKKDREKRGVEGKNEL